jgi:ABC-2 type transport system ATP-binding protein
MISTRIRPTSGDAWVYGKHVVRDVSAVRRLVNVAQQEDALYPTLTAVENLSFFAELYGVESNARAAWIAETLDAVGLTPRKDDRVNTYSGGMRRRLNLGCALVSHPRLLLLDEPTASVDPQSRARSTTRSGGCTHTMSRSSTRRTTSRKRRSSATGSRSWTTVG